MERYDGHGEDVRGCEKAGADTGFRKGGGPGNC